jgi:hypothetical protein
LNGKTRGRKVLLAGLAALSIASAVVAGIALRWTDHADAASVVPAQASGANPTCDDLDDIYGNGQTWSGFSTGGSPTSTTYTVPGRGTITIVAHPGTTFTIDWTSNFGIDAVMIKQGSDTHNLSI